MTEFQTRRIERLQQRLKDAEGRLASKHFKRNEIDVSWLRHELQVAEQEAAV